MPELPDLEIFAGNLERRFKNRTLGKIEIAEAVKLNVPAGELKEAIEGQEIKSISRDGNTLQLHFKNYAVLSLDLLRNGRLAITKDGEKPKFRILVFHFKGGDGFALTDFQMSAIATLNPQKSKIPDALSREMDYTYLKDVLNGNETEIKQVLMDQTLIRGIGSAYADEILWQAGISPFSISAAIPDKEIKILHRTIRYVLLDAIKEIKKEYPHQLTEVRDLLLIHNPSRKKSPRGAIIQINTKGAQKTYFTAEQVLYEL